MCAHMHRNMIATYSHYLLVQIKAREGGEACKYTCACVPVHIHVGSLTHTPQPGSHCHLKT